MTKAFIIELVHVQCVHIYLYNIHVHVCLYTCTCMPLYYTCTCMPLYYTCTCMPLYYTCTCMPLYYTCTVCLYTIRVLYASILYMYMYASILHVCTCIIIIDYYSGMSGQIKGTTHALNPIFLIAYYNMNIEHFQHHRNKYHGKKSLFRDRIVRSQRVSILHPCHEISHCPFVRNSCIDWHHPFGS